MMRSFFLAIGISGLLLGLECLVVEKAEIPADESAVASGFAQRLSPTEFEPPEWAPWSLLSAGAVVILYTFTIPKRST